MSVETESPTTSKGVETAGFILVSQKHLLVDSDTVHLKRIRSNDRVKVIR